MAGDPENQEQRRSRIRKSMSKWRALDEAARRLGRGLGQKELRSRVALETGASVRAVNDALAREGR